MTYVVTLTGFTPTPRFGVGQLPFTIAEIDEAPTIDGPWLLIDSIALDPVDADPSDPATRNLTTDQAELENGWYRVAFVDANGARQYTAPQGADDVLNLRVVVPRIRRALDAPDLPEAEAVAAAADAIARVILYTGDFFGHTLEVLDRDPDFGAPVSWRLDSELAGPELEVVAIQASLDEIAKSAGEMTAQTIRSEGREWSWQKSASALAERLRLLIGERDRALEAIEDSYGGGGLVYYYDFLRTSDNYLERMTWSPFAVDDRFGAA